MSEPGTCFGPLDPARWDAFLQASSLGHMQQSALWEQCKQAEGWRGVRVGIENNGKLTAGFQMLARPTRFGKIAYITKGPVFEDCEPPGLPECLQAIKQCARREAISCVVVQPPDAARFPSDAFLASGFLRNRFLPLSAATLVIDVGCSMEMVMSRMRRTTRLELNRATKRGITIRDGNEADLETFFALMLETCKRQETTPSPGSLAVLRQIWSVFSTQGRIRLNIAEFDGKPVAASICLCFGKRVTFWKKGWSGAHKDKHPNQMVMFDAIQWAQRNGYREFDCLAMTRSTAESLLKGEELTEEQKKGRDFFLLGYGGTPVLFPEAWIYFRNPIIRSGYRASAGFPWVQAVAKRVLRSF